MDNEAVSTPRIAPAQAPYSAAVAAMFERVMPAGVAPLQLFTTLARDERLFSRFTGGGLLDRGHLSLRNRELVIDRVTARCGSEYEWGVHVAFFGERVGLTAGQRAALVWESPEAACWNDQERVLLRACDALLELADVDDPLWASLREHFDELAILEVVMLVGFYRTVSTLTKALRLPLEPFAARFPAR